MHKGNVLAPLFMDNSSFPIVKPVLFVNKGSKTLPLCLGQIHDVRKQQIVMFDSILYLGESCEHWGGLNGRDFNIFCLSPYSIAYYNYYYECLFELF